MVALTGCMYVANSTYLCTPYTVPWAHTPIASGGSFTSGIAGYEAMIRKGRHPGPYPTYRIATAGTGSAADIGLGSISGALYRNHDALFICSTIMSATRTPASRSRRPPRTRG